MSGIFQYAERVVALFLGKGTIIVYWKEEIHLGPFLVFCLLGSIR